MPDLPLQCSVHLATLQADLDARIKSLGKSAPGIAQSRAIVEAALEDGDSHYGINTGFGALASKRISPTQVAELQRNLLISHACGVGEPVPRDITRLMLQLKIHALSQGYSGISEETFALLLRFAELDLLPYIPSRGSVGASGDLAPLAHLALPLIGEGEFWDQNGKPTPAAGVLAAAGLAPVQLQAKDGLALINGTQLMAAYGAYVLAKTRTLVKTADILAAMSLEALQGSIKPFDARIHAIRPHPGQQRVAGNIRILLVDSEILESHRHCGKVQDPYSLRCVPQVHGASRDALEHATKVLETEINAVTDNPLVFPDGDVISGGNFHGQPLALVLDFAAMALAELGSISERRSYLLLEGHDGLPKLLMQDTGVNSGFMIPQYAAAALVSENKVLCHPACVDSIPTSLGQEDHVSMGSISALKLLQVLHNVEHVLAVEMCTAAQALDYRAPRKPGRGVAIAHKTLRAHLAHNEQDYQVRRDLDQCRDLIRAHALTDAVQAEMGALA